MSRVLECIVLASSLFLARTGFSQSGLDDVLKRAQLAQTAKDFRRAAEEYRKGTKLKPSAEIYEKLGLACFLGNSFADAIDAFSQAVRLDSQRWASQLFLGISLYKVNRFREALPHIEQAFKIAPGQNEARYWLGLTYNALGDYGQGIEYLRAALANDPRNLDILYALTEAYLDLAAIASNRLEANGADRKLLKSREGQLGLQALSSYGDTETYDVKARKWLEVEKRHRDVLKSPQPDQEGLYALTKTYEELSQLTAERVWELKPDSDRSHQLLGEAYEAKQAYPKALEEYGLALRINPRGPGLHYSLGHAYWQMKRFDEAIPELKKELDLNPHHGSAHYALGHIYLTRRDLDKAAYHLRLSVEANPDSVEARKQWGKALSLLHQDRKAAQELELAAAADPEDESVHYILAGVYKNMGLRDKAAKELEIFDQLHRKKHIHNGLAGESDAPARE